MIELAVGGKSLSTTVSSNANSRFGALDRAGVLTSFKLHVVVQTVSNANNTATTLDWLDYTVAIACIKSFSSLTLSALEKSSVTSTSNMPLTVNSYE
jgi:hypothetical protein